MIEIDGSVQEGGGQILRTAISLSAITGKDCHIFNIRRRREKPGLFPQHLLGIQAVNQLCNGRLEGDFLGSEEVKFSPGKIQSEELRLKIDTAGSITLILQILTPVCLLAPGPVKIIIDGGATNTFFSPTMDYFQYVFLKILEKAGVKVEMSIAKRGYYPEGGAKIEAVIYPSKPAPYRNEISGTGLKKINLTERGQLRKIVAVSGSSESLKGKKVAERQIFGVREILGKLKLPIEEKIEYEKTLSPGSHICLIAEFENTIIGADNLGKLGKRAEDIGKEAALGLLKEEKSGACLDRHMADQILPYLALAQGKNQVSVSEITGHAKTNVWVIEKFLDGKFETKNNLILWNPS